MHPRVRASCASTSCDVVEHSSHSHRGSVCAIKGIPQTCSCTTEQILLSGFIVSYEVVKLRYVLGLGFPRSFYVFALSSKSWLTM